MKKIFKATIRPIFIGFSFYLFILLGHNTELISNNATRTWSTIIAGVIILYVIIYAAINKKESLEIGAFGFSIAHILFSIGIPIFLIVNEIFFTEQSLKKPSSLLEKENIEFISNPLECHKIKYGTFLNGIDTIIRYSKNDKDYELIKLIGFEEKLNRIKWMDSCSYVRLNNNGSVTNYIKLGNIEKGDHQMYEKPVVSHKMEEEKIKTLTKLKN